MMSIRQWWELVLKISRPAWSNLCKKIRNMKQSDCLKCFLTKTGVLVNWKYWSKNWQHRYCCSKYWVVVDLALSAQYSTCVVNFLISIFSLPKFQFLLGNILSNCFDPYFLFSCKDLIKYLSSVLIPITDVWVLTDVTITSSMAKNM